MLAMSRQPSLWRPWGILVVDDDVVTLRGVLELLRTAGYRATGAVHFEAALSLVHAIPFDLLIADVRLRVDNGLKLIRLAREEQPAMAVIAITGFPDPVVEEECLRLGVAYLLKPLDLQGLLGIVTSQVSGMNRQRRWPRKRIAGGFAARVGDIPAKVVDMSYGGFRLEMAVPFGTDVPASIEVSLMSFGLSVNAELVWTRRLPSSGTWTCGAALLETDSRTTRAWRVVVDALPKSSE